MAKQKDPITYVLLRNISGEMLLNAHQVALGRLAAKGWIGNVERREGGALIWAEHFRERGFWKARIKLFNFALATIRDIEPSRMYPIHHKILFRVSDKEMLGPMGYIRWIDDANDPVFEKVKMYWDEYCRELNTILR